ncbi:TPA: hypothetical protein MW242_003477 [Acinetobacter baumannii]|uniref:hypothetical protein n=1 Tax=Acinetobacter baumannii TaxID=470 RepID=UPI000A3B208E|nr:hypothetical protein [Acinetobacter baumannii]OTT67855.1 hypothetical protein CAT75_17765 [Acinetobacter baumannii]HCA5183831.1 hypothetical protein [Acinetobacter baumannii]
MEKLLKDEIIKTLSAEFKSEDLAHLLNCLDESMVGASKIAAEFCPTKEIQKPFLGQAEHFGIQQAVKTAADHSGFEFELRETNPCGAFYPIISSSSFVIAVRKATSPSIWEKTNHIKELASYNLIFEDGHDDLFQYMNRNRLNSMFMILSIFVLPDSRTNATLLIPSSDLKKVHFAIPLSQVIEASSQPQDQKSVVPVVKLKKQLSELDNQDSSQLKFGS